MSKDVQQFYHYLERANTLLEENTNVTASGAEFSIEHVKSADFSLALFDQWSDFCESTEPLKPPVRVIQHLSCTGGTLIAKCIAGMPNVALLSEANPLCTLQVAASSKFAPTDLTLLAKQGGFPFVNELSEKIFNADIDIIAEHLTQLGKYLVIREHSHSDYHHGKSARKCSTIRKLLKNQHPALCILTLRHPLDSYLSLVNNAWIHYEPATFDEYCKRYLLFVQHNHDVPMFKYENFVADPGRELVSMCQALELPFNEDFQDIFDIYALTGDSGRTSTTIEARKRRDYNAQIKQEVEKSKHYQELLDLLSYENDTD